MSAAALVALSCCVAAVMALAAGYLARVRMPRPPVGVYTSSDVAVLCCGVVVAPLVYRALPEAVVSALFGLVLCTAVQFTLAPLTGSPLAWCAAACGGAVTAVAAVAGHPAAVRTGTGVLLAAAVVGVANLWCQGGMRSVHVASLAAVLSVYDLVATALTSLTADFAARVTGRPFAPLLALTGGDRPVAVGLGDLLMLVLFPLVAAKAYGRRAALLAAAVGITVTSAISALFAAGVLHRGFPLLTALGPFVVAQHLLWSRKSGAERTTRQWQAGTPGPAHPGRPSGPDPDTMAALELAPPPDLAPGTWLAVRDGQVVGTGATPGLAHRAARRSAGAGGSTPLVRQV